jgi:hypothetical protein
MGIGGPFPGLKCGRGVTLTTHPFQCRGREWVGAIHSLPPRLRRCIVGLLYQSSLKSYVNETEVYLCFVSCFDKLGEMGCRSSNFPVAWKWIDPPCSLYVKGPHFLLSKMLQRTGTIETSRWERRVLAVTSLHESALKDQSGVLCHLMGHARNFMNTSVALTLCIAVFMTFTLYFVTTAEK